jgi:exonuclease SbcD
MKLLHTSDWHLGQTFYGHDREEEQRDFLRQIADIVRDKQPDLMVVSGDIFHNSIPSVAAQSLYIDSLINIHNQCPQMPIVITAGNHDSSSKLEVDHKLWKNLGVTIIGTVHWNSDINDIDRHIIPIFNSDKEIVAYVIAIPHCYPSNFPNIDGETPRELRLQRFFSVLQSRVQAINKTDAPVIVMAHLAVAGSDITGHDDVVGGIDYVPLGDLGNSYDYLALGHIHCPQNIGTKARYCGTPIAINFDENYPHSVTLAEITHGAEPQIETIAINNPHPLITIPQEPKPFDDALQALGAFKSDKSCYIRLNVLIDSFLNPNDNVRVSEVCAELNHRYCLIKISRPESTISEQHITLSINELQAASPLSIAESHFKAINGTEMDEKLKAMLSDVVEQINTENQR